MWKSTQSQASAVPQDWEDILGHAPMTTLDHYVRMVSKRAAASIEALD